MEPELEPSSSYIKSFNYGYTLSKHDPVLLDSLIKGITQKNEIKEALQSGKRQFEIDQLIERSKNNNIERER